MNELSIIFLLSIQLCTADWQCRYIRVGWFEDEAECREVGASWDTDRGGIVQGYKCTAQAYEKESK